MATIILKKEPSHNLLGSARVFGYTILYIGVFNFSYTVFLCYKIECKVLRFFRILVIEYISSERSISFNANSEPYFNWSFLDFSLTAFVCYALSITSSSFRQPSAVCCEEGSTNTLVMTDTNNGRLKMITNTLALSQNVPGEFAEAVKWIQMDRNR